MKGEKGEFESSSFYFSHLAFSSLCSFSKYSL